MFNDSFFCLILFPFSEKYHVFSKTTWKILLRLISIALKWIQDTAAWKYVFRICKSNPTGEMLSKYKLKRWKISSVKYFKKPWCDSSRITYIKTFDDISSRMVIITWHFLRTWTNLGKLRLSNVRAKNNYYKSVMIRQCFGYKSHERKKKKTYKSSYSTE